MNDKTERWCVWTLIVLLLWFVPLFFAGLGLYVIGAMICVLVVYLCQKKHLKTTAQTFKKTARTHHTSAARRGAKSQLPSAEGSPNQAKEVPMNDKWDRWVRWALKILFILLVVTPPCLYYVFRSLGIDLFVSAFFVGLGLYVIVGLVFILACYLHKRHLEQLPGSSSYRPNRLVTVLIAGVVGIGMYAVLSTTLPIIKEKTHCCFCHPAPSIDGDDNFSTQERQPSLPEWICLTIILPPLPLLL